MRKLVAWSTFFVVLSIGVIGSGAFTDNGIATCSVAGRVMSPAELDKITGTASCGPCKNGVDCSLQHCTEAGFTCNYCSGTGPDQLCGGQDTTKCTAVTTAGGCGTIQTGGTCDGTHCNGGTNSKTSCSKTNC